MRAILMYHSIDPSGSPVSMDVEDFRRQVRWMAASGVRVVPLEELPGLRDDVDAVALTFDDGFASFATEAWPVLREHGLPATVFVVSGRVGGSNAWNAGSRPAIPDLPLMGWGQVAAVAEEGAGIGGHGATHAPLTGMSPDRLREELEGSRRRLAAETGQEVSALAYPYGSYDARAVAAARETYELATTTRHRLLGDAEDRHLLPRLDASYLRDPARLEAFGTPAFRRCVRYLDLRAKVGRVYRFVRGRLP